jgi:uncharacterized protein YcbK (DUF882 family)
MRCHDNSPYPETFDAPGDGAARLAMLFEVIDAIRDAWGGPLIVVDGYRSPDHNQALIDADAAKGSHQVASGSQHVQGRAVDLRTTGGAKDVPLLLRTILQLHIAGKIEALGGVGDYPTSNWVHVDVRPQVPPGHLARWQGV